MNILVPDAFIDILTDMLLVVLDELESLDDEF
jgi:hypothetical protein